MKALVFISALFFLSSCANKSYWHNSHRHNQHKEMFSKMDANSDGNISSDEFNSAHINMFKEMDTDKNGLVTKEEMASHYKSKCGKDGGCKYKDNSKCNKGGGCKYKDNSKCNKGGGCKYKDKGRGKGKSSPAKK